MTSEELKQRIPGIRWYHTIQFPEGLVTPGIDDSPRKLKNLGLPEDLRGKSVLDIGAWDGFFSFEAERRGAARVLATDWFCWDGGGWGSKKGFDLAHQALGSRVESLRIDIPDISHERLGSFDVVLFLGVLYHLEDPLTALRRIAAVTGSLLILETVCDYIGWSQPVMAFYPGSELSGDPTNWWGPNPAAVLAMLRVAGFTRVRTHYIQPMHQRAAYAFNMRWRNKTGLRSTLRQGRAVFHAWKQ